MKIDWKNSIKLIFSFFIVCIAGKMTPQWIEFQKLTRIQYLFGATIALFISAYFLYEPLKKVLFK